MMKKLDQTLKSKRTSKRIQKVDATLPQPTPSPNPNYRAAADHLMSEAQQGIKNLQPPARPFDSREAEFIHLARGVDDWGRNLNLPPN